MNRVKYLEKILQKWKKGSDEVLLSNCFVPEKCFENRRFHPPTAFCSRIFSLRLGNLYSGSWPSVKLLSIPLENENKKNGHDKSYKSYPRIQVPVRLITLATQS